MKTVDLSILIPARNEQFLAQTVKNLLENIRGNTEILILLDGEWANPPLENDERIRIIYVNESLGQRAGTNYLCKLARGKWIMKIDAHCAVDEGFDVKVTDGAQDDWTIIPIMYNLHAFDWICKCGWRKYQGPTPDKCPQCGNKPEKELKWRAKPSPESMFYRFDKTMHFQYWGEYKKRAQWVNDYADTLSIQGSCFVMTRQKYWELDICEEAFGSWGQQGVEVAMKTWMSGGRVVCNRKTWYAHMFRTQGGDFGFPYPQSGRQIDHARQYSRDLFQHNGWKGAKRSFNEVLEQFRPVPDWHSGESNKGIIYYTDNKLNLKIAHRVQKQLKRVGLPIVSASLKPMKFGDNVVIDGERGPLTMAKQILAALERSTAKYVFFCEHDVIYHPSHFDHTPTRDDTYYYNTNVWRVRLSDGHALWCDDLQQLSGLSANRETLIKHFKERVRRIEQDGYTTAMGFEPGTHNRDERIDDLKAENYLSKYPNIDIRHDGNLTPSRWNKDQFRNDRYTKGWTEADEVPGWGITKNRVPEIIDSI